MNKYIDVKDLEELIVAEPAKDEWGDTVQGCFDERVNVEDLRIVIEAAKTLDEISNRITWDEAGNRICTPVVSSEPVDFTPKWFQSHINRNEPVWKFEHLGHIGEVAFGGETLWSAKLDNAGKFKISTADEAKQLVEQWLKNEINSRIEKANMWLSIYTTPQDQPTLIRELSDALEKAQNGLRWYQDEYPASDSEADGELHEEIDALLTRAKGWGN